MTFDFCQWAFLLSLFQRQLLNENYFSDSQKIRFYQGKCDINQPFGFDFLRFI